MGKSKKSEGDIFQSVPHILMDTIATYPDRNAFLFRRGGRIVSMSYREFGDLVEDLAHGLAAIGLKRHDRVAILSENRVEWAIVDLAVMSIGGIVVPVYQTLSPDQIAYILMDSGVRVIFVENRYHYEKLMQIQEQLPNLKTILTFEPIRNVNGPTTVFKRILRLGDKHRAARPGWFKRTLNKINRDDVCSIVYTSGTTGDPKGVRLRHSGFIENIVNTETALPLKYDDIFLSFLPLSHLYERVAGHWTPMYRGCCIAYARSISTVVEDMQVLHPTVLVSVPQFFDKITAGVHRKISDSGLIRRLTFQWAEKLGNRLAEGRREGKNHPILKSLRPLARKLVFSKLYRYLGGSLRYPISGGAPLPRKTARFFEAMELPIIEGYGLTETHLVVTLSPMENRKEGSCGPPIAGVSIRIADDGEILVRGKTIMNEYHNAPELTASVIDSDGWFHTGDIGFLDKDNYLTITDRKKNIIVISSGEKIAPAPIETKLKDSPYIDEICLIGDGQNFISALIVPDMEAILHWSRKEKLPYEDLEELLPSLELKRLLKYEINLRQKQLAWFERIKKFVVLDHPLEIRKGELTPTMKVRRAVLEGKYWEEIDRMYDSEPEKK
ncbi:MAG: long-chain fatty acid--CoA ligase [Acidobacteria bacterium]|nr:long-chain fatty acid--CoA ligase [Acidobacteriota bacterium]